MDRTHVAGALLLAACFGVALAAGPYGADVQSLGTGTDEQGDYATGQVDATVLETPDTARLDRYTENGTDRYRLLVPDVTLRLANVSGRPALSYRFQIVDLGHTRTTAYVLSEAQEGRFRAALEPSELDTDRVTNDTYTGELTLVVRSDRGTRWIHETTVTVRVTD